MTNAIQTIFMPSSLGIMEEVLIKNDSKPNIEKLSREFTEVFREEIFDYQNQLAFGIFFLKETSSNLKRLLHIEFDDYFESIKLQEKQ